MKKLITILATLSISTPVISNITAFSINHEILIDSLKPQQWSNNNYSSIKINNDESFNIWRGKDEDGNDYDYFITATGTTIYIYLPNGEKHELIKGNNLEYSDIFIIGNSLYFSNKANARSSLVLKFELNQEDITETWDINDKKITEVKGATFNSTQGVKSTFFDSISNLYIMSDKNNISIISFDNQGNASNLIPSITSSSLDNEEFQRRIINVGNNNKQFLALNKKAQINTIVLIDDKSSDIPIENASAIERLNDNYTLLAEGNKIYKLNNSTIDQYLADNYKNNPYSTIDDVNEISEMELLSNGNLKITSEKGVNIYSGLTETENENLTLEEIVIEGDFSFTKTYQGHKGTYWLKDDRSKIGYSREFINLSSYEVNKAYKGNVEASADNIKKDFMSLIIAGQLTKQEEQVIGESVEKQSQIIANDLSLSNTVTKDNWYKETSKSFENTIFANSLKFKISNYNRNVWNNVIREGKYSTSIEVQRKNITDKNLINEIIEDVNKQLGNKVEVVNDITSIDLSTSDTWDFKVKAKDGLLLSDEDKAAIGSITVKFTKFGLEKVIGKFVDEEFAKGLFVGESFEYKLEGWKSDTNAITKEIDGLIVSERQDGDNRIITFTVEKAKNYNFNIESTEQYNVNANIKFTAIEPKLSINGIGNSIKLKEGKSKTFTIENAHMFSDVKVEAISTFEEVGESSNPAKFESEYKDGKLTITAIEPGEDVDLKITATAIRTGIEIPTIEIKLLVPVPVPVNFPLWLILLIAFSILFLLLLLAYFIWEKFFRRKFMRNQPRYAAIVADKNAVTKAKKITKKSDVATLHKDDGFVRSGLFERELEYGLEKLEDPDYEKKYIWVDNGTIEDTSPVVNNWADSKEQDNDKRERKTNSEIESRLKKVKKTVKK
ncbi:hypothetical protein [Spiroplasma diminutum]|uniref:Uncharacterized protein n=1 Tax=Spiroplasma diminutum CUAS-1 TaxID=1276221 RepID=S5MEP8_9MOLU|nr:hypothetical protein [Spiroplasma diminutum]AGR42228.1 hypothetical protein SDIMI_v3c05240 [Spiroplasma diminutum CUAS-1]